MSIHFFQLLQLGDLVFSEIEGREGRQVGERTENSFDLIVPD